MIVRRDVFILCEGDMKLNILKAVIKFVLWVFGFDRMLYNVGFVGPVNIGDTPTEKFVCMKCSFYGGGICQ